MAAGIEPTDFTEDEDIGLILLLRACDAVPQLRLVEDDTLQKRTAIAVLRRVANRVAEAGTGAVESVGRNGTNMKLRDIGSELRATDIDDLRLIFEMPGRDHAGPRGSFPTERPISKLWPETYS